ncbi:hypothetical protein VTL71DRAFT_3996 [Oculimacula yallundae]|uniref:Uncharacterized protein n=1 Tax=Oculimacula yallundae TaxID=86028 RepID=A0ABR4C4L1_9HELO
MALRDQGYHVAGSMLGMHRRQLGVPVDFKLTSIELIRHDFPGGQLGLNVTQSRGVADEPPMLGPRKPGSFRSWVLSASTLLCSALLLTIFYCRYASSNSSRELLHLLCHGEIPF